MAHYAQVDLENNNIVTQVIVADQDFIFKLPGLWIQTSYNTRGGIHYGPDGKPDGGIALRKNYAGVGFTFNHDLDAFIPPKPYPSWVLDETTCLWDAPIPYPDDGEVYYWDEAIVNWALLEPPVTP